MSNYVWSRIICGLDTLDEIIIGDPTNLSHSIVSFHKLFDVQYDDSEARSVLKRSIGGKKKPLLLRAFLILLCSSLIYHFYANSCVLRS